MSNIEQLSDSEIISELAAAAKDGDQKRTCLLKQEAVSRLESYAVPNETLESQYYEFDHNTETNELDEKIQEANYSLVRYLSMSDVKDGGLVWRDMTQKEKDDSLYAVGLDVKNFRYITHLDTHITFKGKPFNGVRFICNERLDTDWIQSGYASQEAELTFRGDPSFSREIYRMQAGVNEVRVGSQDAEY